MSTVSKAKRATKRPRAETPVASEAQPAPVAAVPEVESVPVKVKKARSKKSVPEVQPVEQAPVVESAVDPVAEAAVEAVEEAVAPKVSRKRAKLTAEFAQNRAKELRDNFAKIMSETLTSKKPVTKKQWNVIDRGHKELAKLTTTFATKSQNSKKTRRTTDPANCPLIKPVRITEELAKLIGSDVLISRPNVSKLLAVYIKANGMLDPKNGQYIIPTPEFADFIGYKEGDEPDGLTWFKLSKYTQKHYVKNNDKEAVAVQ
jgi:chromatin remodeling complex protein RSC6